MATETTPLISDNKATSNHQQNHHKHHQHHQHARLFENPVTGASEPLTPITDYAPLDSQDEDFANLVGDEEALLENQPQSRNRRQVFVNKTKQKYKRHAVLYSVVGLYLTVVLLEAFDVIAAPFGFIMAGLLAVGGTMGFVKKGSLPSLIAGYTFAILYAAAGYLSMKSNNDKNNGNANSLGIKIALGSSVVLTLVGAKRSYSTRFESNVPIMLFFLGLLATGYYVFKQVQL